MSWRRKGILVWGRIFQPRGLSNAESPRQEQTSIPEESRVVMKRDWIE